MRIYRGCVVKTFRRAVGGEGGFNLKWLLAALIYLMDT